MLIAKDQNGYYTKDIQIPNKHMKRCSLSFIGRDMHVKIM